MTPHARLLLAAGCGSAVLDGPTHKARHLHYCYLLQANTLRLRDRLSEQQLQFKHVHVIALLVFFCAQDVLQVLLCIPQQLLCRRALL